MLDHGAMLDPTADSAMKVAGTPLHQLFAKFLSSTSPSEELINQINIRKRMPIAADDKGEITKQVKSFKEKFEAALLNNQNIDLTANQLIVLALAYQFTKFGIETNLDYAKKCLEKINELSDGYDLLLMSNDMKDEDLKKGNVYLREKDGCIAYTVVTPDDEIVRDIKIDALKAPKPFSIAELNKVKERILDITSKEGHTLSDSTSQKAYAKYLLGIMYQYEIGGVKQDVAKAIKFYKEAATLGSSGANVELAEIYTKGNTVVADDFQAKRHLDLAANSQDPVAFYELAKLYHKEGGEDNLKKAFSYLTVAAKQGYIPALNELGVAYLHGTGTAKDSALAMQYFQIAADISSTTSIAQNQLLLRIETFLRHIKSKDTTGSETSEYLPHLNGMCNGLAFMILRAAAIGETNKFVERLKRFTAMNYADIQKMSELYTLFRSNFESAIQQIRNERKTANTSITDEKTEENSSEYDLAVQRVYQNLKYNNRNLNETEKELLDFARDFYIFVNSLWFGQLPATTGMITNDRMIAHQDFIPMLQTIPPDLLQGKDLATLQPSMQFVFNFTDNELTKTLERAITTNDFVMLTSTNHTMFFVKEADKFLFYDSNNKEIKYFADWKSLVDEIKYCFFTKLGYSANYLPIYFQAIHLDGAKNDSAMAADTSSDTKPSVTAEQLMKDILAERESKVDIDVSAWSGETSLWLAARYGDHQLARILLENKADPNKANNRGTSPMEVAVYKNYPETVKVLAEYQANLELRDKDGRTPACLAAVLGNVSVLKVLAEAGANLNALGDFGGSPLCEAAWYGHADIVAFLLNTKENYNYGVNLANQKNYGVNLYIKDCERHTPLDLAAAGGHTQIVEMLNKHDIYAKLNEQSSLYLAAESKHWDTLALLLLKYKGDKFEDGLAKILKDNASHVVKGFQDYVGSKDDETKIFLIKLLLDPNNALNKLLCEALKPKFSLQSLQSIFTPATKFDGNVFVPPALAACIEPFKDLKTPTANLPLSSLKWK